MLPNHRDFRLRVYFDTKMPVTLERPSPQESARSQERSCSACCPAAFLAPSLQGSQCHTAGLLCQGLALRCAPAGCAWDWRVGGPLTQRQVVLVVGVALAAGG